MGLRRTKTNENSEFASGRSLSPQHYSRRRFNRRSKLQAGEGIFCCSAKVSDGSYQLFGNSGG